jgi:predicted DNA-binding transcriptional regulator AlpA
MKKTLNLTELAEYLEWNKRTLYRKVKAGDFPVDPIPGTKPRKWLTAAIDAWLEGRV